MEQDPPLEDFEDLVRPISDDHPAGPDPQDDPDPESPYRLVQQAHRTAQESERQLAKWNAYSEEEKQMERENGAPEAAAPDWQAVKHRAIDLLAGTAKDLWVACWLIEALARTDGFAGLRDGFRLVRELCEQDDIWNGIHPRPEEGETIRYTLARLDGLGDGGLTDEINRIFITGPDNGLGRYTGSDFVDAAALETLTDETTRARRIAAGAVPLDTIEKAARTSGADFYRNLLQELGDTCREFDAMVDVLESRCGDDAPSSTATRKVLEEAKRRVEMLAKDLLPVDEPSEGEAEEGEEGTLVASDGQAVASVATAQVNNRDQAFRALLQVADFFRKTEPQSPVSDALEQAVRWGRMSFRELMEDLLASDDARRDLFMRTGTREDEDDGAS